MSVHRTNKGAYVPFPGVIGKNRLIEYFFEELTLILIFSRQNEIYHEILNTSSDYDIKQQQIVNLNSKHVLHYSSNYLKFQDI